MSKKAKGSTKSKSTTSKAKRPTVTDLAAKVDAQAEVMTKIAAYLRTGRGQLVSDRARACDDVLAAIDSL